VHGKTLGILGFGRIGQAVARRGALGFGMPVLYCNRSPVDVPELAGRARQVPLDALLRDSDIVAATLPLTDETRGLMNAERFAAMRPGAIFVNGSRGGIVDEPALHDALVSGKLAGAGLDVFEQEPPPPGHSLFALPNVIFAPHVAGVTREAVDRMSEQTAKNILSVLDGDPLRQNVINQDVL